METERSFASSEQVFEIAYQPFDGARGEVDEQARGSLRVRGGGAVYIFTGMERRALSFSRPTAVTFTADQIWNVAVTGPRVEFATVTAKTGRKGEPFVFYCRSAAEAARVAAILPATRDSESHAAEEFSRRIGQLPVPAKSWGWVTNQIIAANVVAFVVMGVLGAGWFEVADMMPYIRFGANRADVTTDGEWWRLVTCMFLHFGLVHLLLNMWALLQTGHLVEQLFGRPLYAVVYFGSGIAGSVASLLWDRRDLAWSAGASGAVFGVYGALIGYALRERRGLPKAVFQPLLKSTLAFAGYNIFFGLVHPNIDNAAHLGGLTGGIALGWALALPIDREARARLWTRRLMLGLGLTGLVVIGGMVGAPRFDYHLQDEIEWQRTNESPASREAEMLQGQGPAIAAYTDRNDTAALQRWLSEKAIPFYADWRKDLRALQLQPGRRTDRQRAALVRVIELKLDAYEKLAGAIERGDATAIADYRVAERRIAEEIKNLPGRANGRD